MNWRKLGVVFSPDGVVSWQNSHAMLPTPFLLNKDVIRVFVTFCDQGGRGRPGYVDVSANDPTQVLKVSSTPLLELGRPGTFDENGVAVCSVIRMPDERLFMYYVGFELGTQIRYRLLTGLSISEDGGETFCRYSTVPVLERSGDELYFRCGPWAMVADDHIRMWYVAGSDWELIDAKSMPNYDIRYIESRDGIRWPSVGDVQIAVEKEDEYGFGRPAVLEKKDKGLRMFYSVRRRSFNAYRLGYAESDDGRCWRRMDESLNLDVTPHSFDSDAIMYAAPIQVGNDLYVFYNGNDFGRQGMAVAKLETLAQ